MRKFSSFDIMLKMTAILLGIVIAVYLIIIICNFYSHECKIDAIHISKKDIVTEETIQEKPNATFRYSIEPPIKNTKQIVPVSKELDKNIVAA